MFKNIRRFSTTVLHPQSRRSNIIGRRNRFLSPSLKTFEAYDKPMILEKGDKQYLWDIDGNKYLDLLGQNLCMSVGYNRTKIKTAVMEQMDKLAHCTTMYYHEEPGKLAENIVKKLPERPDGEDWVVHFVNSGSEAVDLAIQMARVYTNRQETIALYKAYHGLHGYAAGVTAIGKATQSCYAGMFNGIHHIMANRLDELEDKIKFGTGGSLACMILEPLQGYGGIFPLDKDYMKEAFKMVNNAGGVTISDEVQTGYGRTGESFWGFQNEHNDAMPDMVTMAKGMGNGVAIIGAVACKRSIADAFTKKMFFNTYGSNPTACAAANAVLSIMDEEKIMHNCDAQGKILNWKMRQLCGEFPDIFKEVRGQGLFQGLEINGKNQEDSQKKAYRIHKNLLKHGLIVGRGSAAGNVFRLQPPMCIEEKDVNHIVDALKKGAIEERLNLF
jgi:alanine-glyoxylate transaminase / (R)-3-amino-2-methylpropionate-pyruvate transaminase